MIPYTERTFHAYLVEDVVSIFAHITFMRNGVEGEAIEASAALCGRRSVACTAIG